MIITNVNDGQKVPYSVSGTLLTVGDVTIDLQARQTSEQRVIDICLDNQLKTMAEGLGAWYVANIIIPPKQKELINTGRQDEHENEIMEEVERPLDMNGVELRLWGLPANYGQNLEKPEQTPSDKEQTEGATE
ncbi:AAA family ATPase [Heyndrickxia coagulans]|uniref:AAA family ATPase n=1 Tax=Heyndrickxia coagulans TaxID=1398 RepID=UPI0014592FD2|nr:AAA family ATPase [Heyndrickxia coagulans]